MRKLMALLLIGISFSAFGQKFTAGVQAGYVSASYLAGGDQYINASAISAYEFGATGSFHLKDHLYLESGLRWIQKGSVKTKTIIAVNGGSTSIKINYLELPLNLDYKFKLNKNVKGFVGAGIYFAAGMSGKETGQEVTIAGNNAINRNVQFTTSSNYSANYTSVTPIDFGTDAFAGVEYKNFDVAVNYSKSSSKVETTSSTKYQHQTFGVSVGYAWNLK